MAIENLKWLEKEHIRLKKKIIKFLALRKKNNLALRKALALDLGVKKQIREADNENH